MWKTYPFFGRFTNGFDTTDPTPGRLHWWHDYLKPLPFNMETQSTVPKNLSPEKNHESRITFSGLHCLNLKVSQKWGLQKNINKKSVSCLLKMHHSEIRWEFFGKKKTFGSFGSTYGQNQANDLLPRVRSCHPSNKSAGFLVVSSNVTWRFLARKQVSKTIFWTYTPEDVTAWNISSWRFGSDHFPF